VVKIAGFAMRETPPVALFPLCAQIFTELLLL